MREAFEQRLARRAFTSLVVCTVWLEPRDYPVLVGMASMGVCLHQSSSGLDLPMKLADLRGAGVPAASGFLISVAMFNLLASENDAGAARWLPFDVQLIWVSGIIDQVDMGLFARPQS